MATDRRADDEVPLPADPDDFPTDVSRRSFLRWSALAGAGASLAGVAGTAARGETLVPTRKFDFDLEEATIAEMQLQMASGDLTAGELVDLYLERITGIDQGGDPGLNSILEVNPDARAIADALDAERAASGPRGPLHGIPIVIKDNIDTADAMGTRAGSLALVGAPALQDATVAERLRAAGAIILAKANLSEWANFRGFNSSSGWCGVAGQCRNPYVLDRNPCGSSSGSAAAVAANLCAAALGTETDGSIVCPSSANCVVGIKPTVGLTSRAGVIPISATQDTVGPHGRTVADAAAVLGALVGVDPRDPATAGSAGRFYRDYSFFVDPDGLDGARIGVDFRLTGFSDEADVVFAQALDAIADAGATVVPIEIPTLGQFGFDEVVVLVYEFKRDLNAYLATRAGVPVASLADVQAFNLANADAELKYFGQEWVDLAEAELFSEEQYLESVERGPRLAGPEGLDAIIDQEDLDAIVAPTNSPAWPIDLPNGDCFLGGSSSTAAVAGYPLITVPAGFRFGLPVGVTFMGKAWSEPLLIRIASGFEHATRARRPPRLVETLLRNEVRTGVRRQLARPFESETARPARSAEQALARLLAGRHTFVHGL